MLSTFTESTILSLAGFIVIVGISLLIYAHVLRNDRRKNKRKPLYRNTFIFSGLILIIFGASLRPIYLNQQDDYINKQLDTNLTKFVRKDPDQLSDNKYDMQITATYFQKIDYDNRNNSAVVTVNDDDLTMLDVTPKTVDYLLKSPKKLADMRRYDEDYPKVKVVYEGKTIARNHHHYNIIDGE